MATKKSSGSATKRVLSKKKCTGKQAKKISHNKRSKNYQKKYRGQGR